MTDHIAMPNGEAERIARTCAERCALRGATWTVAGFLLFFLLGGDSFIAAGLGLGSCILGVLHARWSVLDDLRREVRHYIH